MSINLHRQHPLRQHPSCKHTDTSTLAHEIKHKKYLETKNIHAIKHLYAWRILIITNSL